MLVRVLFKVDVVEQPHIAPEIHVLAVAQFLGVPAHDPFHRQCVLEMEMILIVLAQQLPRCLPLHGLFHLWFLLVYFANRSLTTWLAAMSPATGGTKGTLPGVLRRVLPGSGSGWNNVLWGSSVE